MKTTKLFLATAILTVGLLSGCKKDDTEAPVVTLNGSASETKSLNTSYLDPLATATDDEDGSVTVTSDFSTTNPDMNKTGSYTITYSATDAAGNVGTASRTVIVKNDADYLAGTYGVTEAGNPSWVQTVSASTTKNNVIVFSKFANYSNNTTISAKVTGSSIELDPALQQVAGIGTNGCTHKFTANGTSIVAQVGSNWGFSIKFMDETVNTGGACSGTAPVAYEDFMLQQ